MGQIFKLDILYISFDKKKYSYMIFEDEETMNPNLNLFLNNIIVLSYL